MISTFEIADAGMDSNLRINNEGVILGTYYNLLGPGFLHAGFTRELSGVIRKWMHPNDKDKFTRIHAINGAGIVVGEYSDSQTFHSFLLNTKIDN